MPKCFNCAILTPAKVSRTKVSYTTFRCVTLTRSSGFTLIELLVVLVVVGLLMSVAVMNMGGNQLNRELDNQVTRLHALLRTAADNAIITNTEIGFSIDKEGYSFLTYDDKKQKWEKFSDAKLRSYTFPDWLVIDFSREGKEIKLPIAAEDQQTTDEAPLASPEIALLSSGESTPFTLRIQIAGLDEPVYIIRSDGIKPIKLERPGGELQ